VIIFGMMRFRKSDRLDVDQDDEGQAKDPVGHVTDNVVEVRKQVEGPCTSEITLALK
jgi:hypothetical protein